MLSCLQSCVSHKLRTQSATFLIPTRAGNHLFLPTHRLLLQWSRSHYTGLTAEPEYSLSRGPELYGSSRNEETTSVRSWGYQDNTSKDLRFMQARSRLNIAGSERYSSNPSQSEDVQEDASSQDETIASNRSRIKQLSNQHHETQTETTNIRISQIETSDDDWWWQKFGAVKINPVELVHRLVNMTEHAVRDGMTIEITATAVEAISGTKEDNMWIHKDGRGCDVRIIPASDPDSLTRQVVLQGSPRAQEITRDYLLAIDAESRADITIARRIHSKAGRQQVVQMTKPTVWTIRSFYQYVSNITSIRLPRATSRPSNSVARSHHEATAKNLESLFTNVDLQPYMSSAALGRALEFCRKHTDLVQTETMIWRSARKCKIVPTVSTFNQILGRCLRMRDTRKFKAFLLAMGRFGVAPNATTYLLLFAHVETASERWLLKEHLEKKGFLYNYEDRIKLANVFIKKDFPSFILQENGLHCFIQQMDRRFGRDWFNVRTVGTMLSSYRRTNNSNIATELINLAGARGVRLDMPLVLQLSHLARKLGNIEDMVELLHSDVAGQVLEGFEEVIYHAFHLAWNKRCLNLCRVLWHYAASSGILSYDMRKLVKASLITNTKESSHPSDRIWTSIAGKLIVGTNLNTEDFDKLFPFLCQDGVKQNPMVWLFGWTMNDGTRNDQLMLVHLILERDRQAWRFYRTLPHEHFLDLIRTAYETDRQWETANLTTTTNPLDLLNKMTSINLEARPKPLPIPGQSRKEARAGNAARWFVVNGYRLDRYSLTLPADLQDQSSVAKVSRRKQASLSKPTAIAKEAVPENHNTHTNVLNVATMAAGSVPYINNSLKLSWNEAGTLQRFDVRTPQGCDLDVAEPSSMPGTENGRASDFSPFYDGADVPGSTYSDSQMTKFKDLDAMIDRLLDDIGGEKLEHKEPDLFNSPDVEGLVDGILGEVNDLVKRHGIHQRS